MLSTCPSCLNQILHEDHRDSVVCECGENFSPFLTVSPIMEMNNSSPLIAMGEKNPILQDLGIEEHRESEFAESEAAFAELRTFGETLNSTESLPDAPLTPVAAPTENMNPNPVTSSAVPVASVVQNNSLHLPITAGDQIVGYSIETFMSPISIWCAANTDSEDPLKTSYQLLAQRSENLGANGVVSVRWSFTPDGSRILLTGTPVKCVKLA